MTSSSADLGSTGTPAGRPSRRRFRRRLAVLAGLVLLGGAAVGIAVLRRPDAGARARATRDEAALRIATGDGAAVLPILDALVAERPNDGQARYLLATALFDAGNRAKAAEHVAILLGSHADLRGVRLLSARCHLASGDPRGALAELALCPEPDQVTASVVRGQILSSLGRLAEASQAYAAADVIVDGNSGLLADAALVELRLAAGGTPDAAQRRVRAESLGRKLDEVARAAEGLAEPGDVGPLLDRAIAAEAMGRASSGEILTLYDKAVAAAADPARAFVARAAFAARAGLRDELRAMVAAGLQAKRATTPEVAVRLATCAGTPEPEDIESLCATVAAWPEDDGLRTVIVRTLLAAGHAQRADEIARAARPEAGVELRIAGAEAAEAAGDAFRANAVVEALTAERPDDPGVRLLRARHAIHTLARRPDGVGPAERSAIQASIDSMLGADPDDPAILDVATRFALADGRGADAWRHAQRLLRNAPNARGARALALAVAFRAAPDREVETLAERATPDETTSPEEFLGIAESALGAGRPAVALAVARRGCARHPGDLRLRRFLARALIASSDPAGAEAVILADPAGGRDPDSTRILAEARALAGKTDEALALLPFRAAREDTLTRARILTASGRADEAERGLRALLGTNPADHAARILLSQVLVSAGRPADAVEVLEAPASAEDVPSPVLAALAAAHAASSLETAAASGRLAELRTRLQGRPDGAADASRIDSWIALASGDLAASRAALEKYLQERPADGTAWHDLALLRARGNDLPGTLEAARKAVALAPWNPASRTLLARTLFLEASARFGARDLASARTAIDEALVLDPEWAPAQRGLAAVLAAQGLPDLSEVQCRRILEIDPKDVTARVILAHALRARGDSAGALTVADSLVADHPESVELRLHRGLLRLTSGDAAKAQEDFEFARAHGAAGAVLEFGLAGCAVSAGKADEAMAHAKRAVELAPENPLSHAALGEALRLKGDVDGAVASFIASFDRDPSATAPLVAAAKVLVVNRRFEDAVRICGRIRAPTGDLALLAGEAHLGAGRPAEARRLFETAAFDDSRAWARAGVAADAAGDSAGAIEHLRRAVTVTPGDRQVRTFLAVVLEKSGHRGDAIEILRALVEEKADDLVALNNLATVLVDGILEPPPPASPSTQLARCRESLDFAKRARALDPAQPDVADTLGWATWLSGDEAAARKLLGESIERGDRADARFHLAVIDDAAGRRDEARRNLELALRASPAAPWAARARELLDRK